MGCASSAPQEDPPDSPRSTGDPGSFSEIVAERQATLGEKKFLARKRAGKAETVISGVLSLASAFDAYDTDKSAGLSICELRGALEQLGIGTSTEMADRILKQYDQYPDEVIDVKEFASIVRDIQLMQTWDTNGDSVLDADELLPCLHCACHRIPTTFLAGVARGGRPAEDRTLESQPFAALGLKVDATQVDEIMARFDVDQSGTIDLVELSSLVRTAQAFVRYDTDGSGAIDTDELRDALRKLGLKAGALEADVLFRRYDADGNGTLELHEFAVLVRDLQL